MNPRTGRPGSDKITESDIVVPERLTHFGYHQKSENVSIFPEIFLCQFFRKNFFCQKSLFWNLENINERMLFTCFTDRLNLDRNRYEYESTKTKEKWTNDVIAKKYFANFVKSGASYKSFAFEYLRIFKKSTSRSTYHRIKKNADSILGLVTHRTKNATYNRKIDDELKQFERHCRTVIIKCHQRRFAIRLNTTAVAQVMQNEAEKLDFPKNSQYKIFDHGR